MEQDDTLMTDQQKEEEAMIKHTFNFYLQGKAGAPLERYELPMILDGKSTSTQTLYRTISLYWDILLQILAVPCLEKLIWCQLFWQ